MVSVEVYTKARMLAIENSTVVDGVVNGDGNLILKQRDGTEINAGDVKRLLPPRLAATNNIGVNNDPDTLLETGWYSGHNWVGSLVGVYNGVATLEVIQYSPDWIVQTLTAPGVTSRIFNRSRYNAAWSSWMELNDWLTLRNKPEGPAGVISEYAGEVAPSGYLMCNGQAVSRVGEARLFAVCGTRYGAGDGSTTFNVPNKNGRIGVGFDPLQSEFNVLGKLGGTKTHQHTEGDMAASIGAVGANQHTIGYIAAGVAPRGPKSVGSYWLSGMTGNTSVQAFSHNTPVYGTTAPESNLPPHIALNYIIKS